MDEIKTGVDANWVLDSRVALRKLIHIYEGEDAPRIARLAAEFADEMEAERMKRGGFRDPSDIRNTLATIEEHLPAALAFFESLDKMAAKRGAVRKAQRRNRGEHDDD
jgi:hypothetical protein